MTLIKRADKGQGLTYEEMDGNFTHLGGDGSYQFPATDGLASQVLTTDGNGNLSFQTISLDEITGDIKGSVFADDSTKLVDGVEGKIVGPVESDSIKGNFTGSMFLEDSTELISQEGNISANSLSTRDTIIHLGLLTGDSSAPADGSIAIGYKAGWREQSATGIFDGEGKFASIAIGWEAGERDQKTESVAIGGQAGQFGQPSQSVAIGAFAQNFVQDGNVGCTHIGYRAGSSMPGANNVAIGYSAGRTTQGSNAVAIGYAAGYNNQGDYCIAIGSGTGFNNQPDNTIIIDASNNSIAPSGTDECYISPIREVTGGSAPAGFSPMYYNPTTKEVIVVSP